VAWQYKEVKVAIKWFALHALQLSVICVENKSLGMTIFEQAEVVCCSMRQRSCGGKGDGRSKLVGTLRRHFGTML